MDLTLFPATVTDYNTQRTGARFTVRSANSPSYSFSRRAGVRKRETAEETGRRTHGTNAVSDTKEDTVSSVFTRSHSSVRGQYEERKASGHKMTVRLKDTEDKPASQSGSDRGKNSAFEDRGQAEWKRNTFSCRSKSLNWRTGNRSPDRTTKADRVARVADGSRRALSTFERRAEFEGDEMKKVAHVSHTLEKANWCNSLPSRWRSGPKNQLAEAGSSPGLKGGQSIHERIEKLYGSAGLYKADEPKVRDSSMSETADALISQRQISFGKTADGTFPRRFSAEHFHTLGKNWIPPIGAQNATSASGSQALLSLQRGSTRGRSLGRQWEGQTWNRCSDGGGVTWRKGFVDSGTRSLDRARSKNTVAAQMRAAWAAAGTSSVHQPNSVSGGISDYFRDSDRYRERTTGSKTESRTTFGEEKSETNKIKGLSIEKTGRVRSQEEDKETDNGVKGKTKCKSSTIDEEVFERNPMRNGERTKVLERSSVPSVRNKIDQFEALTQTGPESNQVSMPKRTFSVPVQLSRNHEGVKKSRSAKDIDRLRNRTEGPTGGVDVGGKEKAMRMRETFWSKRSLSVDEVGLRLERKDSGDNYVVEEVKSNDCHDPDKYSRLYKTGHTPQNEGGPINNKTFFIDETDFKVCSPDGENKKNAPVNNKSSIEVCGDASAGKQECTPSQSNAPVTDDDKMPTNTPDHSPFIAPATQVEDATPSADCQNKRSFVFTQESGSQDADAPPLLGSFTFPPPSNLAELVSSDVRKAQPRGRKQLLDLDAWITGLNPEFKGWRYEEDDEDDDESTQKDEDSNYDSDSGESSVTVTSNMSQSDHRNFSINLSDLCNFTGVDSESDDSDEWQSGSRRSASLSSDVSALSYVSVMPAEELDRLMDDVKSLGNNTLQDYDDVQVVVLHKDVGVGLGFSMAGGVDQNKPITVHKVFHSGVAAKEGSLREGDRVLSINGTALQGMAHWEALRILRRAKTREMGVVVLRRGDATGPPKRGVQEKSSGPTQPQYETGQRVCVQLQKNSRDLGFSLEGGVGSSEGNRPLAVQKVFLGGPVDKVCSGDEILEIQGTSVVAMRRLEVWTLIRALPAGPVDVVLRRPPNPPET